MKNKKFKKKIIELIKLTLQSKPIDTTAKSVHYGMSFKNQLGEQ